DSYLKECAARNGLPVPEISAEACDALIAYDWPGNIRELRNAVERALAMCDSGVIQPGDLPEAVRTFGQRPRTNLLNGADRHSPLPASPEFSRTGPESISIFEPTAGESRAQHPGLSACSSRDTAPNAGGEVPVDGQMSPLARARAEGELERIK